MRFKKISTHIALALLISFSLSACNEDDNSTDIVVTNPTVDSNTVNTWEIRASSFAEAKNIDIEDAKHRLTMMDNVSKASPMIEDYFGEDVAGMYFGVQDYEFVLNVRTNRKDASSISDYNMIQQVKEESGIPLNILLNSAHNETQMSSFLNDLEKNTLGREKFLNYIYYDPEIDSIVASLKEGEHTSAEYLSFKEKLQSNSFGTKVVMSNNHPLPTTDANAFSEPVVGGGVLSLRQYETGCTAGFPAYLNGVKGVLSAGHCGDLNYYTSNLGTTYPLGRDTGSTSTRFDIEFYPVLTTQPLLPAIYTNTNSVNTIPINRIGTRSDYFFNDWVCHYGKTNGYTCGELKGIVQSPSVNGCNGWSIYGYCDKSYMLISGETSGDLLRAGSGDSGGPWIKTLSTGENMAYGIHSSSSRSTIPPLYTNAYVSPIYLAYELGNGTLQIPTQP